jgi:hypothetical protein
VLVSAGILLYTSTNNKKRVLDERLSFRKNDKIPYGTFAAFEGLKELFPKASISNSREEPGYWDSLDMKEGGQALVIVTPQFFADNYEMRKLIEFVSTGNDVFISAAIISEEAKSVLKCGISYLDVYAMFMSGVQQTDSLYVSLNNPPFKRSYTYTYPGKRFASYFYEVDTSTTVVLGMGEDGRANFIHLKSGLGNFFVHLSPMTFSNYFLLKKNNYQYYEDLLSVMSPNITSVVWDEYFLMKKSPSNQQTKRKGWVQAFLQHEALRWALLTAIFTILLYTLMEMRRKQRPIPVITKPRNDSLDFVKTIGRLYYDKGDHKNLTKKMTAYFLEHVRTRYKLSTTRLNEEFIEQLQYKTGVQSPEIRNIVSFIQEMEGAEKINDQQLAYFHKQLELFYSKI